MLREALRTLDQVVGESADCVLVVNREHRHLYVNRAAASVLGHLRQELVGKTWRDIGMSSEVMEPFFREVDDVFETGERRTGEIADLLGHGTKFHYSLSASHRADGSTEAVLAVLRDMTEMHRTQERLKAERDRFRFLQQILSVADEGEDLQKTCIGILDELREHLGLEAGYISVYEPDDKLLRIAAYTVDLDPEMIEMVRVMQAGSPALVARCFREGRMLNHADDDTDWGRMHRDRNRRYVCVPLVSRNQRAVGVASLSFLGLRDFTRDELDLFQLLGSLVAASIDSAHLLEVEKATSASLQEAYMQHDDIPGVNHSAVYLSSSQLARIGGDFYDLFPLGDFRFAIVMGDVSGKGVPAAALTTLVKATLRTHLFRGCGPREALFYVNDAILRSTSAETFATIFLAVLDSESETLVWCNAGHVSPLVRRQDGSVHRLHPTCPISGAFAEYRCGAEEERFSPGDILLMYTDGLSEALVDGALFGEESVSELLGAWDEDIDELPQALVSKLGDLGAEVRDDVAILALTLAEEGRSVTDAGAVAEAPAAGA